MAIVRIWIAESADCLVVRIVIQMLPLILHRQLKMPDEDKCSGASESSIGGWMVSMATRHVWVLLGAVCCIRSPSSLWFLSKAFICKFWWLLQCSREVERLGDRFFYFFIVLRSCSFRKYIMAKWSFEFINFRWQNTSFSTLPTTPPTFCGINGKL